ncbi:carbon-nitrogen hydrolase family protein [Methanospirillum stamsii]|uniref:Nitrilase n=1 Tax=Methanospirillum stamsii TaxID=1277351 RepID=A0A2V2MZP4_9EURY|nr:carbon-nitrogen hydrolase family protein [Methanospirillum stamsii]PWR71800.1 nitrilase [Methanospirillum stamsii]
MILSLAQITPCWNDPTKTLKKMEKYAAEAVEGDATFLVFPEQILTGWDPKNNSEVTTEDGEEISALKDIAQDYSIGILGSFREKNTDHPFNTSIAIGPDGKTLASYQKIHLFSPAGEDRYFSPGNSLGIFSFNSCTIGIAICYDLRFAPLFHAYRDAGVNLMLVPSAWPASRLKHFHLFTTSRAAEFQMFVASVNTVGQTPVDFYNGGSCIAGPDGSIRAQGTDLEELIFYDMPIEEAETLRISFPFHKDVRNDFL